MGQFALAGQPPGIAAKAVFAPTEGGWHFDYVAVDRAAGKPIRSYDVDLEQTMHLIVVRDDFSTFVHAHPTLRRDGHFVSTIPADHARRYYAFADTRPRGMSQQVVRFVFGVSAHAGRPQLPSHTSAYVGPYTVTLDRRHVKAGFAATMLVSIRRGAIKPQELEPYLGVPAHIVLIDTARLSYVHVHPTLAGATHAMGAMSGTAHTMAERAGPDLMIELPALEPGTYAMWVQFKASGKVFVAPFSLLAHIQFD